MIYGTRRLFYISLLLACLFLALPPFFVLADEPAPAAALPSFVKARLDHFDGKTIGDDRWLEPGAIVAYEWVAPPASFLRSVFAWQLKYIITNAQQNSTRTLTGSPSGYARLWDSATAKLLWETRPTKTPITSLEFVDQTAAVAIVGQEMIVLNLKDGSELRKIPLPPCASPCSTSALRIDGHFFTITEFSNASASPILRLWSVPEDKILHTFQITGPTQTLRKIEIANKTLIAYFSKPIPDDPNDDSDDDSDDPNILEPETVSLWSLSDGLLLNTLSISAQWDISDYEYKPTEITINLAKTHAAWLSQNTSTDPPSSSLFLVSLSDSTKPASLPIPDPNGGVPFVIQFSPDNKILAAAYSTDPTATLFFADISDGILKNPRQHTISGLPKAPDGEPTEDDYGNPLVYFPEISSATFSKDLKNLFVSFTYVTYATFSGRGDVPDVSTYRSDEEFSLSLTAATAKPNKTKPPAAPAEIPPSPSFPHIPPDDFNPYFALTLSYYFFSSPDGAALAGLYSDGKDIIWPVPNPPFSISSRGFKIFGPTGQVYDFQKATACESSQDGSIGVTDPTSKTHTILHANPRLFPEKAHLLPDGQLLLCQFKYSDEVSTCDIEIPYQQDGYDDEESELNNPLYASRKLQLERFNPADKTFTPIPSPPELENCDFLLSPASLRATLANHVMSLSDNKVILSVEKGEGLELSPNGRYAAALQSSKLVVYDVETQALILSPDLQCTEYADFHFSPNSKYVAFFPKLEGKMSQVHIFDLDAKALVSTFDLPFSDPRFSPDGLFLIATHNNDLQIIDIKTTKTVKTLSEHTKPTARFVFSADGKTLFSAQEDGRSIAWDWPAIAASLTQK